MICLGLSLKKNTSKNTPIERNSSTSSSHHLTVNGMMSCFFSPVHPHELYTLYLQHGYDVNPDIEFFCIPIELLSSYDVTIWTFPFTCCCEKHPEQYDEEYYIPFSADTYQETPVPAETQEYYSHYKATHNDMPFTWYRIPHYLVKGSIPIKTLKVIRWSDPPK